MGRIRTIKPEFFKHSGLFDAEQETGLPLRLGYAGLWTCCDREGRFKWRPRELKLDILPYDNCEFSHVLDALASRGFLVKYGSGTEVFGHIPSWKTHQFINNKEAQSTLPNPIDYQQVDAFVTRDGRVEDTTGTRGVKEGKGKEGDTEDGPPTRFSIASTAHAVSSSEVVTIWNEATAGKLPAAKLTTKRKATIKTRLKEPGWLQDFRAACAFLANTPWYSGDNDRHWVATLDFALQAGKATELAEKATQPAALTAATCDTTPKPQTAYERDREEQFAERKRILASLEAAS
jgi:hypothetical protein